MKVNRDQFLEDGYFIQRNAIPPDQLADLRAAYEIMVEHQKIIWARDRDPDGPPGGVWEMGAQPRLALHNMGDQLDAQTAQTIEIWLHENTLGTSTQLLQMPHAAVTEMMMMCNPVRDRGPAGWHRDMYPPYCAPLMGYVDDIVENGPRYVQWNISLYEDDVLCVIPGSHIRYRTDEEQAAMAGDRKGELAGAVQIDHQRQALFE